MDGKKGITEELDNWRYELECAVKAIKNKSIEEVEEIKFERITSDLIEMRIRYGKTIGS